MLKPFYEKTLKKVILLNAKYNPTIFTLKIVQTSRRFTRNIFVLTPSMMYDRRGFHGRSFDYIIAAAL